MEKVGQSQRVAESVSKVARALQENLATKALRHIEKRVFVQLFLAIVFVSSLPWWLSQS